MTNLFIFSWFHISLLFLFVNSFFWEIELWYLIYRISIWFFFFRFNFLNALQLSICWLWFLLLLYRHFFLFLSLLNCINLVDLFLSLNFLPIIFIDPLKAWSSGILNLNCTLSIKYDIVYLFLNLKLQGSLMHICLTEWRNVNIHILLSQLVSNITEYYKLFLVTF